MTKLNPEGRQRQSRFQRDPDRYKNLYLGERDAFILIALVQERILSTSQIAALFFGQKSGAIRRLNQLWNAGYVDRGFAPVSFGMSEAIYSPTRKGIQFLIEEKVVPQEELSWNPKSYKVTNWKKQHELMVNDVKIAMILALAKRFNLYMPQPEVKYVPKGNAKAKERPDLGRVGEILIFEKGSEYDDRVRDPDAQGNSRYIPIRPDRFMVLNLPEVPAYGLWEVDRGTMPERNFRRKTEGLPAILFLRRFSEKIWCARSGYRGLSLQSVYSDTRCDAKEQLGSAGEDDRQQ